MAADAATPPALPLPSWPVLNAQERRLLGVLIEKAQTTQGGSPMSLNALVTGCNQKSNRDPAMSLNEHQVEEALTSAQKNGLVTKIIGGRVEHWKHCLYDAWRVSKVELAVLAELLLRGPQTEGELRGRASRMEPIADVEALRGILRPLVERQLVVYLTPEGRRGTMVTHGFHAPEELARLRARHSAEAPVTQAEATPTLANFAAPTTPETHTQLAFLQTQVTELQAKVADLEQDVRRIKDGLGL